MLEAMDGGEEEFTAAVPRSVQLRQCLVLSDNFVADTEFPVGFIEVPDVVTEEGTPVNKVALIALLESNGRVVVAIPAKAWNRTIRHRLLPPDALLKPTLADVLFCDRAVSATAATGTKKIWIGQLAAEFEDLVTFDSFTFEPTLPDIPFDIAGPTLLPLAESLAQLAEDSFGFTTAPSGEGQPATKGAALDNRLRSLEASVQTIAEKLAHLGPAAVPLPPRPSALKASPKTTVLKPPTSSPAGPCSPPGLEPLGAMVEGLDLEVVRSARLAGIPEEQIAEMAALASRGKSRMPDLPVGRARAAAAAAQLLSDSEEDEVVPEVDEKGLQSDGGTLVSAVAKLTQIAASLTAQKQKATSLDAILDGVGSAGSSDSGGLPGTRKYAAALRALRRTLQTKPEDLYRVLERNMEEDFQLQSQMPGSAPVAVSARAWLELRSKVQPYPTPVRLLWGIAGVLDCLRSNQVAQARARCGLLLAQGDQLSIDKGAWLIAGELSLEEPPPMSAFTSHALPSETEAPYTKLIDGRWFDLCLHKLHDYDQLQEKKKKLSYKKPAGAASTVPGAEASAKAEVKRKGKSKGKGKNAASGSAEAEEPPPTTS